ncbi:hypothetical protein DFQ28_010924 [Apophysomyces sp. BC1034]|nr:hypothetical protein DFQ28_010924 [Apophysomyces sp. BC1034]
MVYGLSDASSGLWEDSQRTKRGNTASGSDSSQAERVNALQKSIREQKILLAALEGDNEPVGYDLDDLKVRIRAISREAKENERSSTSMGPSSRQRLTPQLWTRYKLNLQSMEDIADQSRTLKKELSYLLNTSVRDTYAKLLVETERLNRASLDLTRAKAGKGSSTGHSNVSDADCIRAKAHAMVDARLHTPNSSDDILHVVESECRQRLSELDQQLSRINQTEEDVHMLMERELASIDAEVEYGRKELRKRQMFEQGLFVSDTLARFIDLLDAPASDGSFSHSRFDPPSRSSSAPALVTPPTIVTPKEDISAPPPIPTSQRPGSPRSAVDIKAEARRRIEQRRQLFVNKYNQSTPTEVKRSTSFENNDVSEDEKVAQEKLRRAEAEARERLVTMREKRNKMRQQEAEAEEKRKKAVAEAAAAAEAEMLEEKRRKQIEEEERREKIRRAEAELAEKLRQKQQAELERLEKEKAEEEKRERELARKKEEEERLAEKTRQHRARAAAEKAARERRLRQEEIERQGREIEEARLQEERRRQEWQEAENKRREALKREKEEKEREEAAKIEAARIEAERRKQQEEEIEARLRQAADTVPTLEDEKQDESETPSSIKSNEATAGTSGYGIDIEDEVNFSSIYRVKTLYEYRGIREDDLSFTEDEIIKAHPSKDSSSDWWYGTSLSTNLVGFFPRTYVEVIEEAFRVRTLYEFKKTREDDLGFVENEIILVQPFQDEHSDWWYGSNEDTREYGYFPKTYAKLIEAGSTKANEGSTTTSSEIANGSSPIWVTSNTRSGSDGNLLSVSDADLPRGLSAPNTPVMKKTALGMNKIELSRRRRAASNASTGTISTPNLVLSHPRPESPVLTTWASTMDEHELDVIPLEERTRQEAIYEMISSERTYLRDLQMIVNIFYVDSGKYLSQEEQDVVFANVDDLLLCNTALLSDLEARQRENANVIDSIGDIFIKHILKSTPKKHSDYGLVRSALAGAERVLDVVNEETRRYENGQKISELSRILDMGNHGRLDVRGREFVMDGVLFKTKSGRKLHGYLFNDVLILTEALKGLSPEGYLYRLYREPMNIDDVSIRQQNMSLKTSFGNSSGKGICQRT